MEIKKYLPSKKFVRLIGSFLIVGIVFVIVFVVFFSQKSIFKHTNKPGQLGADRLSVLKLSQVDTDGDGVQDWQEALWGTDKNNPATFNGVSDLKYIDNKKKELGISQDPKNEQNLTETEKFAREFFSTYIAMKDSGQLDNTTINNFSSTLGKKIADPTILDQYSDTDIIPDTSNEGAGDPQKYYFEIKKLFDQYRSSGIGEELSIVNNSLMANSKTSDGSQKRLLDIANAYKSFAQKMMGVPVPKNLIQDHLAVANSSNNSGISVENMAKVSTDPIMGLSGLSQYQKYSNDFVNSAGALETKALE